MSFHHRRGPVLVPYLGLSLTFDQVYARTNVPVTLHQVDGADEEGTEIVLD
jgi:hypothetical protein